MATSENTQPPKTKNLGGRPAFEFTPKILAQVERLAGLGLTQTQIAYCIGISPATLTGKKHLPIVANVLEAGRSKAAAIVGDALFIRAKDGDVPAIRWYEMTRQGRSERSFVATNQPTSITVRLVKPSDR
jgi:hypothetical protein